ncbi:unnamed protein product [Calypogeia fissa]
MAILAQEEGESRRKNQAAAGVNQRQSAQLHDCMLSLKIIFRVILVACLLLNLPLTGLVTAETFDYKDALTKSILFFEAQRSGKLPANQRVTWRGDSALRDGALANVDLTGGYYDAGDNVKFGFPMAFTLTMLSWGAIEYNNQLSQAGELQNVEAAIRWGTDYLLKAHTGPTELWVQVGNPQTDHTCWERPEDMDTARTVLKVNETFPGSEVVAETAAALAAASIVFKSSDPGYSSTLLNAAMQLFDFADTYRGNFSGACPFYCSHSGYHDELLWASAWLYKAAQMDKYLEYVINNQYSIGSVSEFSWENKVAGVHVLLSKIYFSGEDRLSRYKQLADGFFCYILPSSPLRTIKFTPGGLVYVRIGSNTQYGLNAAFLAGVYAGYMAEANIDQFMCGSTAFTRADLIAFSDSQANYILGANPLHMSYMTGFGNNYPLQPHHRGASIVSIHVKPEMVGCGAGFYYWFARDAPNANLLTGAVAGGPDPEDGFVDRRSSSSYTEPTTYVNAPMVGLMARLLFASPS